MNRLWNTARAPDSHARTSEVPRNSIGRYSRVVTPCDHAYRMWYLTEGAGSVRVEC